MFGSGILDTAVGLSFIYLLFALVCTMVNEWISTVVNKRGKTLFEGIKNLLNDPGFTALAQQLYTHGLVDCISKDASDPKKSNRLPSYIPSATFSLALIDILRSRGLEVSWRLELQRRRLDLEASQVKAAETPAAAPQQGVLDAQNAFDEAARAYNTAYAVALAHQDSAELAAKVTGPKDLIRLQEASAELQKALSLGRDIAARLPNPLEGVERAVEALPRGHTRETLLVLIDKTKRDAQLLSAGVQNAGQHLELFRTNVEAWFDDAMARVGGWYKRWTQVVQFGLAVLLVIATNADTIGIANRLTHDTDLRAGLVTSALQSASSTQLRQSVDGASATANPPAPASSQSSATGAKEAELASTLLAQAAHLNLPLGWGCAQTGKGLRNCVAPDSTESNPEPKGAAPEAKTAASEPKAGPSEPKARASQPNANAPMKSASHAGDQNENSSNEDWLVAVERRLVAVWDGLAYAAPWFLKMVGWAITVLAVSLGAPFWFDTLSKFVNLRGAGTPPGETKKSASRPTTS